MRNPFRKEYSGSAREKYLAKGSKSAQDAEDWVQAGKDIQKAKAKEQKAAGQVAMAKSKVMKCAKSKVKPGVMKCGKVGSGVYCSKHRHEGTTITKAGG